MKNMARTENAVQNFCIIHTEKRLQNVYRMEVTDSLHCPRDLNREKVVLEDQGRDGNPSLKQEGFLENNESAQQDSDDSCTGTTFFMGSVSFNVYNGEVSSSTRFTSKTI
jgi:hypothetical protein